jgi:copper chaperone CopZ
MDTVVLKTNLHCQKCIEKVEPVLQTMGFNSINFNLSNPNKLIEIQGDNINIPKIQERLHKEGYEVEQYNESFSIDVEPLKTTKGFWKDKDVWKRSSFNTLNCLIGCSIGDFGMIIYLQAYHPETSMVVQMVLAIIAGLSTSIILETILLKKREKFNWNEAFKIAFSMSFISMIGMEIAMNTTDFIITGGKADFTSAVYWLALIPALIAGFIFLNCEDKC